MSEYANPNSCEYLASFGINPKSVMLDDCNDWGYRALQLDKDGKRMPCPHCGEAVRLNWVEWPEGFSYTTLAAKWVEDGHYFSYGHMFHRVEVEDE